MRFPITALRVLLPAVLLLLAAGCGDSTGREAVQGTVQFKGQPLDHGTVEFHPEDTSGAATFEGATITAGKYVVPADKGLLPGKYRVMISSGDEKERADVEAAPGESGPPAKERIPARYNSESQEVVEVKPGGPNTFDFDIK